MGERLGSPKKINDVGKYNSEAFHRCAQPFSMRKLQCTCVCVLENEKLDRECETTEWNKPLGNSWADLGNLIVSCNL